MNVIETLLGNPIAQSLGWALIHFIWQGALIALLYLCASVLLRRFESGARYAAGCAAMLLMLAAPVITMFARGNSLEPRPDFAVETAPLTDTVVAATTSPDARIVSASRSEIGSAAAFDPQSMKQWAADRLPELIPWLLALWLAGVMFLSLRFAGGLIMVRRLKRAGKSTALELWDEKFDGLRRRLRVSRAVRLCESALVEVPTVIGWLKPVILIPTSALTGLSPDQLEALLAHELAHIRRYDYLVNILQTAVETLLFYHPAVWWVSAQVRQEREHCCDDLAVAACGDVLTYARALTALEQMRASEPRLAVAASGGSLLVRIQRLIQGRAPALYGMESWFAGFLAVAAVVIVLAGAQTTFLSRGAQAAVNDPTRLVYSESGMAPAGETADEPRHNSVARGGAGKVRESAPVANTQAVQAVRDPADNQAPAQDDKSGESHDFASEMASVGLTNLSIDELVALKVHGVTAQIVREMSALVPGKLKAEDVVAMTIHGVNAAFANEMKALGLRLNAEEMVAFKIHGVTAQFIDEMKNTGVRKLDADSLVAFRIHGVTPAFIQQMKDLGFANLSGEELAAFKIHDVSPLFIQTMRTYIHGHLSAEDLAGLRIHGVTPEMIKELEIMGFANLSAEDLTAFKIHGVTPSFIKSIQAAGYSRITAEQLTGLRIYGVTPEFIQMVRSRGFTDVTLDQLVELRRLNILPSRKKAN